MQPLVIHGAAQPHDRPAWLGVLESLQAGQGHDDPTWGLMCCCGCDRAVAQSSWRVVNRGVTRADRDVTVT